VSLTLRGDDPMVTAPALAVVGAPTALILASGITHDAFLTVLTVALTAGMGLGLKWLQWSIKRALRDMVDQEIHRLGGTEPKAVDPPKS
jgi:hypothetical protein